MPEYTFIKRLFSSFLSLMLIAFMANCTKSSKPTITDSTYNFSYIGKLETYDSIRFTSTAPAGSTFLWAFGDGDISTAPDPIHIYTYALPDTVTLIVSSDTLHPIKKILKISPGAERLVGNWKWTGGYLSTYGRDTTSPHPLNDTTFAIGFVNDSTISVWGGPLIYNTVPGHPIGAFISDGPPENSIGIWYQNDSIYFSEISGGLGGGESIRYHTP